MSLRDGGGLARAVHAGQHDHERLRAVDHERHGNWLQEPQQRLAQRAFELLTLAQTFAPHRGA